MRVPFDFDPWSEKPFFGSRIHGRQFREHIPGHAVVTSKRRAAVNPFFSPPKCMRGEWGPRNILNPIPPETQRPRIVPQEFSRALLACFGDAPARVWPWLQYAQCDLFPSPPTSPAKTHFPKCHPCHLLGSLREQLGKSNSDTLSNLSKLGDAGPRTVSPFFPQLIVPSSV